MRNDSYGETKNLSTLDKLGQLLSTKKIKKISKYCQNKTVLDLGCGYNANLSLQNFNQAKKIILVDISIDKSIKNKKNNIEILEGKIPEILNEIENHSIDILIANNIIEHLVNPLETLIVLKDKLSTDARFYINVPSWFGRYFLEYSAFDLGFSPAVEMNDHKWYFGKKDLWKLMIDSGFLPEQIKIKSSKFGLNSTATNRMN